MPGSGAHADNQRPYEREFRLILKLEIQRTSEKLCDGSLSCTVVVGCSLREAAMRQELLMRCTDACISATDFLNAERGMLPISAATARWAALRCASTVRLVSDVARCARRRCSLSDHFNQLTKRNCQFVGRSTELYRPTRATRHTHSTLHFQLSLPTQQRAFSFHFRNWTWILIATLVAKINRRA
eukprot:3304282-Amphidinium_carterae.1